MLPILSLLVMITVFWWLKLTGITLAGDAFCGIEEHFHTEDCTVRTLICTEEIEAEEPAAEEAEPAFSEDFTLDEPVSDSPAETPAEPPAETAEPTEESPTEETPAADSGDSVPDTADSIVTTHIHTDACYEITYTCSLEEHIHDTSCYSNITADTETAADWEAALPELSTDDYAGNIIAVAQSQLGYTESEVNFDVDAEGIRRGYTRYGEWYGNPYGDWSTMFTSFCLRYAGITDLPVSSGADALRIQWESGMRYFPAGEYTPIPGDVVFLDKNGNGSPEATAIITAVSDETISVIEGDLANQVAEAEYALTGTEITGYGLTTPESLLALTALEEKVLATAVVYNADLFTGDSSFILYTMGNDGEYYAIDGNANAVQIQISDEGNITADIDDPTRLYWTFAAAADYDNRDAFYIQNMSTGMYMHPYSDGGGSGAILSGRWESALYPNGSGVRIRGARQNSYAYLQNNSFFTNTGTLNGASTFYLGQTLPMITVWLDGTYGGQRSLSGSLNMGYQVEEGSTFILPLTWQSPSKYSYIIQGWYDVINHQYYLPGAEITVTDSMVFYPDWVAETYDIGEFNAQTADTVSTSEFITTRVFDYNFLFNVLSTEASVTANAAEHSETWKMVPEGSAVDYQNGAVPGGESLDFVMIDSGGGSISSPNDRNADNSYNANVPLKPGMYNDTLGEVLFGTENSFDPYTGTGVLGKQYLGTADHLFQFGSDPSSEYYGYYYYDSALNAASYNQTDQRFYVYEYLERTSDSAGSGKYSDFLPLNSPYANNNGSDVPTYSYNGENGEYAGTDHYQFDVFGNNSNAAANFWFGMSMETKFYLPDDPGSADDANQDVYGNDMHFRFAGDDDVWVLVDGEVVLDLGGIHGAVSGDINFTTGKISTNGTVSDLPASITSGEHTLTVYYLERGSSQSNCVMFFNLAPRYSLTLQKEDVLTQELLNGAQFSVYTDPNCTVPAELWISEDSYNSNDPATNVFTIENGKTIMWGLGAGKTYYLRETHPPDKEEYSFAHGIICLTLDKSGNASYRVEIITETDEDGNVVDTISKGFTVHGFRIDEESQHAYIVATNAPEWVQEVTSIQVMKVWDDTEDHSGDSVTVYLTVTDPDGTVRRIREVELSEANDWTYIWVNMPKYWEDGTTPVEYGVEEAYKSGYTPTIEKVDKIETVVSGWSPVNTFENGKTYLLKTSSGFLSTISSTSTSSYIIQWVDEETAKTSSLAQWTVTITGGKIKFTNGAGQILTFNNGNNSNSRYFYATRNSSTYQTFTPVDTGNGFRFYITRYTTNYYVGKLNNSRLSSTTTAANGLIFMPYSFIESSIETPLEGCGFKVTNRPLENETSVTVTKAWDTGQATNVNYQQSQVTVKLLADGKDTGRTVTLTLKNGWTDTFLGLPYTREDGDPIVYTVEETWETEDWVPTYGEIITVPPSGTNDANPTYSTTITNTYQHSGPMLPSTGGFGPALWVVTGFSMMAGSVLYGYVLRRKQERRYHKRNL